MLSPVRLSVRLFVFFVGAYLLYALFTVWCLIILVLMCIFRATVSAVSCLFVSAFICIDLLVSCALKLNDDDDDDVHVLRERIVGEWDKLHVRLHSVKHFTLFHLI